MDAKDKAHYFLSGIRAAQHGQPRSTDPKSVLIRNPDWLRILDVFDAGWDFWTNNKAVLLEYGCTVTGQ